MKGSNNTNLEVSKDDTGISFLRTGNASDYLKNDNTLNKNNPLNVKRGWVGGSNKKKYTIKRLPNKKYTISKKMKNARLYKTRNRNIRNKNKTRINKQI